jgi:hypothetical protein
MRRLTYILFVIFIFLFVASCGLDTKVNLFIGDLLEVVEKSETIMTKSTVKLEVGSNDECRKEQKNLISYVETYIGKVKNPRCIDEDMSSFFVLNTQIPVFKYKHIPNSHTMKSVQGPKRIFSIGIRQGNKKYHDWGNYSVAVKINNNMFEELNSILSDKYFSTLEPKDIKLSIDLSNDLRQDTEVLLMSSYVDGIPEPLFTERKLSRRGNINIEVSTISMLHKFKNSGGTIFQFK